MYDYSNPQTAREHLLALEYAEHRLYGLGAAIAKVGCLVMVPSYGFLEAGQLASYSVAQEVGRGGLWAGAAMVAAGGICTVYERVGAAVTKRKMHAFVRGWIESKET